MDTGPILSCGSIPILPDDSAGTLLARLAPLGADLLLETLPRYLSGELQPQPQPADGITYAPMLKKEAGLLDFTQPAVDLERRVRAFDPWPGTRFVWNNQPLKVIRALRRRRKKPGRGDPAYGRWETRPRHRRGSAYPGRGPTCGQKGNGGKGLPGWCENVG